MPDPKITVLMTVFNGGRYFPLAIESILSQTFSDLELLIVDDCSTDNSMEIAKSYDDERIVIIPNERNMGQTKSLNKGLRHARGEYIARMDADDMAFEKWLECQWKFICENTEYDVVSTRAAVMDNENRIIRLLNSAVSEGEILLRCLTASPINHVGSLAKKRVLAEHNGYDEHFNIPADYDLWSRLIQQGHRIASTREVLVAIRFHGSSVSVKESGDRDSAEMSDIMQRNIQNLTTYSIDKKDLELYRLLNYNVETLDTDQFYRALDILRGVYNNLKKDLKLDQHLVDNVKNRLIKKLYVKRIFMCIHRGNVREVRLISKDYTQRYGRVNILSLIWIVSLLGSAILKILPFSYEQLLKIRMRTQLNWMLYSQRIRW